MRLADPKNADRLDEAAEQNGNAVADLSVRGAAKLLAKPRTEEQKAARAVKKKKLSKGPDIAEQLKALAPDEVLKALKDAEWDTEELSELAKLLNTHLAEVQKAKVDPLAIPPVLQRTPPSGSQPGVVPHTASAASGPASNAGFVRRT
jgi:hypothetical protein